MAHELTNLVEDTSRLREIYQAPIKGAIAKEIARLDHHCRAFIALSPFVCVGSMDGHHRADVSPRGGEPGFVHVLDEHRLAIPDRPGNNRLDSITNLLQQPNVALLFFVPGFEDTLRVNGRARISLDPELMGRFLVDGRAPRSVMIVNVQEAQFHCGKAIRRAGLWDPATKVERSSFPSPGEILKDHCLSSVEVAVIDKMVEQDARENLY
jgi:PPOX class probable FMN-dependent enzyme